MSYKAARPLMVSQVTPLVYRDGITLLQLIKELSDYVQNILQPGLNSVLERLTEDISSQLDEAAENYVLGVEQFQHIHDAFMSDVNAALIALNDKAVGDLVSDPGSSVGEALRELFPNKQVVEDQIQGFEGQLQVVEDQIQGFEERFPTIDDFDDFKESQDQAFTVFRDGVLDDQQNLRDENTAYQTTINQALDQVVQQVDGKGNITSEYHDKGARVVYGTIRSRADGSWYLLEDSSHIADAIDEIITTDTGVEIITRPPKSGTISGGTIIAVTDETLAKNGFRVGGSGGGTKTVLQFGRSKSISDRIWFENGEFQTHNKNFQVSEVDGTITLTHERMYGLTNVSVSPWPTNQGAIYIPVVMAANAVQTVVRLYSLNGDQAGSFTENTRFFITRSDDTSRTIDPHTIGHVGTGNVWFLLVQPYK